MGSAAVSDLIESTSVMRKQLPLTVHTVVLLLCGMALMGDEDMPGKQMSLSQGNQKTRSQQEGLREDIEKRELETEFRRDKNQLRRISQVLEEFPRLTKLADALHVKWSELDPTLHAELMLEVVRGIRPEYAVPWKQHYAARGLQQAAELPLRLNAQLVEQMRIPSSKMVREHFTPDEWSERRKEQMRHWFRLYRRINATEDPKWDDDDFKWSQDVTKDFKHIKPGWPPQMPPFPPGLTEGISGTRVPPESIEDPKARQAYIEGLEEHRLYKQKWLELSQARTLQTRFPSMERYIAFVYGCPPYNDDQLQAFLDAYVEDEAARERILQRLSRHRQ